jgi:hypothetical protein
MSLLGLNDLARETGITRGQLKEWAEKGVIPFVKGKLNRMMFSYEVSVKAIEAHLGDKLEHGTRSLPAHHVGTDGQRPDCMEKKPGV